MSDNLLSIGAVARQTGCKVETIRFYEREHLLPEPGRSPGGHRQYGHADVDRLVFIRRSRELGFSMNEIRQLLSLVDDRQASCARVRAVAAAHLEDIHRKITDLRRMESTLRDLVSRCTGTSVPDCPIIEALRP